MIVGENSKGWSGKNPSSRVTQEYLNWEEKVSPVATHAGGTANAEALQHVPGRF